MGDVMPEKRSEIRATWRDSGAITLVAREAVLRRRSLGAARARL